MQSAEQIAKALQSHSNYLGRLYGRSPQPPAHRTQVASAKRYIVFLQKQLREALQREGKRVEHALLGPVLR